MISPKIQIFLGTKAQLIKMAPIMSELAKSNIAYRFIFSGQHHETIDDLIDSFQIKKPDLNLSPKTEVNTIFRGFKWLIKMLFLGLFQRKKIFGQTEKNTILLVHGDTMSTFLGAIFGKFAGLKIAHIESGLRSFKLLHPFPEEITRLLTFQLTDYYFCPNQWALNNLKKYRGEKFNTQGNTLIDSLKFALANPTTSNETAQIINSKKKYAIVSLHRLENIFSHQKLQNIINQILKIPKELEIIFVLHQPTLIALQKSQLIDLLKSTTNVRIIRRQNFPAFITLLAKSEFLISDGGSNQEECSYLGLPCLLMRAASERTEGLNQNIILSNYDEKIIQDFFQNYSKYKKPHTNFTSSPSTIIVQKLQNFIKKTS